MYPAPAMPIPIPDAPAPGDGPLPPHILGDIAAGIAAARPLWGAVVRHDADQRQPVRLLATPGYEVWVIGWGPGQGVEPHDHGASAGALVVTSGTLTEVVVPRPGRAVEHPLEPGRVRHVPAGAVHDVVNRAAGPATSIHVYSPPLTAMTYYDLGTLAPVATVGQPPDGPLLAGRAASFLLHPAHRG